MTNISDLKQAIRKGDTELVEQIAEELFDNDIDLSSALQLAKQMNKIGKSRGKWQDIVDVLESYFE